MSAPASTNLTDIITLPVSGISNITEADFSVSCELMKNQLKATPVDPNTNILVAQNSQGQPMIFSIGNEGQFNLLQFQQGQAGYQLTDLLSGFTGYTSAKAFDLTQDIQGRISIVVALQKTGSTNTDLFMASMLSNEVTVTDWAKFASLCTPLQGADAGFAAGNIILGSSADGKSPLAAIAGADGAGADTFYYLLTNPDQPLVKKQLPENTSSAAAMDLGFAFGQRGIFFLYQAGASQTLECTTLADQFEGSETYDFSPGNSNIPAPWQHQQYNCLAVADGMSTNAFTMSSDLYVGTDKGIMLFRGLDIENGFQMVTSGIEDVHQLVVREDAANIVIWALASPGRLYYIVGKKGAVYQWNDPILFNQAAIHAAPIRYTGSQANELYLVDQQENLLHYWQDPKTTLWYHQTIRVKTEDYLVDFTSFTTNIQITDASGCGLTGQPLRLTASSWIYATINGLLYSIDKDVPATVITDETGSINIIQMTADIAPPELYLDADFLQNTLTIYPNGKIQKGLQQIKSGADLKAAKGQDGKPVLTQNLPDSTLDGVADNTGQLNTAAQSDGTKNIAAGNQFVAVMPKGARSSALLTAHLPENFAVGMKLVNGVWAPHGGPEGLVKGGGIGKDIITFLGDALHFIETAFADGIKLVEKGITYLADGVSFVITKVAQGLRFVMTLVDKVIDVVLDTLVSVFKVLNWILKLVGIDLAAILRWLGHLIGWDDIWQTHKVLATMMNNALNYGGRRFGDVIDDIKNHVSHFFDNAESIFNANQPSPQVMAQSLSGRSMLGSPVNSAAGSWVFKQVRHNGLMQSDNNNTPVSNNPFLQFINDVIIPTVNVIADDLAKDLQDIARLMSGDIGAVVTLAGDLLKTVLDPVKTIILGILQFIKDLINDIVALLTQPLNIPFLSAMYKYVTGALGEAEELTVTNGIALLIAIPVTIIWKLSGHGAPFAGGTYGFDSPDFYPSILGDTGSSLAPAGAKKSELMYIKVGGSIAAGASIINSFCTMWTAAKDDNDETNPLLKIKSLKMSKMDIAQVGLGLAISACTVPMKKEDPRKVEYGFAMTNFVLSTIKNVFFPFIPDEKYRLLVMSIADVVITGFAIPLDVISGAKGFGWAQDMLSDVGGAVYDGCQVLSKGDPDPDSKAALKVASVLGAGSMYFGSIFTVVNALEADDVVYVINPGG